MKDLDRMLLATLEEPGLVCLANPDLGSVQIPVPFVLRLLRGLSGAAVKLYLALAVLTLPQARPASPQGSAIDALCELAGLARDQALEGLKELEERRLVCVQARYLRDTSRPEDWSFARSESYALETRPALVVELAAARLAPGTADQHAAVGQEAEPAPRPHAAPGLPNDADESAAIAVQTQITEGFRVAQELLVTIGNREMQAIELWLRKFGYGPDMVRAVIEYGISRGKRDIGYASVVAREWHKAGVRDSETLEAYMVQQEDMRGRFAAVRRLMGRHDGLTQPERDQYDTWTKGWGFSDELIALACKELTKARTPSFEYVNTILDSWRAAGVKTLDDAERLMAKDRAAKAAGRSRAKPGKSGTSHTKRAEDAGYYAQYAKLEEELLDGGGGDPSGKGGAV